MARFVTVLKIFVDGVIGSLYPLSYGEPRRNGEMEMKTVIKLGKDVQEGDRVVLEGGNTVRLNELTRAPIRIQYEDGSFAKGVRWGYFNGGHVTICADDEVTVVA